MAEGLLNKMRGEGMAVPARAANAAILKAGLGGMLAIGSVAALTQASANPLVLGSFGATCVLAFGFPDAPFSQPRNIVFGHLLSSAVGLLCLNLLGPSWWAMAIAAGLAIALMMALRVVHPPAGSNPVIVFLSQPGLSFLILPTLIGALLVTAVALVYNNLTREASYPKYW